MPKSMTRSTMTNNVWYRSMLVGNEPFSLGAYELIESNILTSSASSVTFSSIPQDYKHLQIRATVRSVSGTDDLWVRFNSDSGSNYALHRLSGTGSAVSSLGQSSLTEIKLSNGMAQDAYANVYGGLVIDILDYASASKNTTLRALHGRAQGGSDWVSLSSGLWQSVSNVTSIDLIGADTIQTASRFSLYGLRG